MKKYIYACISLKKLWHLLLMYDMKKNSLLPYTHTCFNCFKAWRKGGGGILVAVARNGNILFIIYMYKYMAFIFLDSIKAFVRCGRY